jgi:branched-chain amino acid transport system substrate-binding protein
MHGPSARDAIAVNKGIELALAQAGDRAGRFTIDYTLLDDSTGLAGWSPSQTAANARRAAADPKTVLYIGEFDDDASEVSMPILNQAGIPQVSPANTYVGLTSGASRVTRSSPSGAAPPPRTYLRIVPSDGVQAAADLLAMKQAGCTRVAVADDGEEYGADLANLVEAGRRWYGVEVVNALPFVLSGAGVRRSALAIREQRAGCILLAGVASRASVRVTGDLHAALPSARIFAPDRMCTSAWTNPGDGGVPNSVDPLIECTAVTLSLAAYPGGKAFLAAYKTQYGSSDPGPYAILGYEAMSLGLSTIARLGPDGASRSAVRSALFSITDRHSVLGTYGFESDGDTTLRSYGLYKVGANGDPRFVRAITPPHVV